MCVLTAAGRLVGVTGVLVVVEGTVWTDGGDEVEQEQSRTHPAAKAGNPDKTTPGLRRVPGGGLRAGTWRADHVARVRPRTNL